MEMSIEKRNEFIEANMGIIGDIAKPYEPLAVGKGYCFLDLINSGVQGMILGIDRYDIKKATKENGVVPLEAFVRHDVRRMISKFIAKPRVHDRTKNKVSMQAQISSKNGDSITVEEMLAGQEHVVNHGDKIDLDVMRDVLKSGVLSECELMAVKMRFMDQMGFKEMDAVFQKHLDNPKSKSFYFVNQGLKKLRESMEVGL